MPGAAAQQSRRPRFISSHLIQVWHCSDCDFDAETAFSGFVSLGASVAAGTVLGAETTGWIKSESETTAQVYSLMGHITQYVTPRSGLFVRAGLGIVWYREDTDFADLSAKAFGFSGRIGYEFGRGNVVAVPYVGLVRTFKGADFAIDGDDVGFNAAVSNFQFGLAIGTH